MEVRYSDSRVKERTCDIATIEAASNVAPQVYNDEDGGEERVRQHGGADGMIRGSKGLGFRLP